jgi:hypothetical protein
VTRHQPDTRLSSREVTRKYALKIVVKHANSGTVIQMEVIFLPQICPTTKSLTTMYKNGE